MKDTNNYSIEELIEIGSFSNLNEIQKEIVLNEMSANAYNQFRRVMLKNQAFISLDQFALEPNSEIEHNLMRKLKPSPIKKTIVRKIYISVSAAAAIFILFLLLNTYFSSKPSSSNKPVIAEKNKPIDFPEKQKLKHTKTTIAKQTFEKEKEIKEQPLKKESVKIKKETKSPANDPEEFNKLIAEDIFIEADEDIDICLYTDESDQAFHYYTHLE
jgi:hypothetical protein